MAPWGSALGLCLLLCMAQAHADEADAQLSLEFLEFLADDEAWQASAQDLPPSPSPPTASSAEESAP